MSVFLRTHISCCIGGWAENCTPTLRDALSDVLEKRRVANAYPSDLQSPRDLYRGKGVDYVAVEERLGDRLESMGKSRRYDSVIDYARLQCRRRLGAVLWVKRVWPNSMRD